MRSLTSGETAARVFMQLTPDIASPHMCPASAADRDRIIRLGVVRAILQPEPLHNV